MRHRHRATTLPLLMTLALLTASGANAQDMEGWPEWLVEAMAEESKTIKYKTVDINDGTYAFEVAGRPTKPEAFDGGWYFSANIGRSSAALECYIFDTDADLGTLANTLTEIGIEATAEANNGTVANRSVFAIDAGGIDGKPFLAIEWIFTVGEGSNTVVGFNKVRVAANGAITQACSHNTPGYRESFAEAFATLVRSTQQPAPEYEPYFEELALQKLDGETIGTALVRYTLDEDGDTFIQTTTAALFPIGPDAVMSIDSSDKSWSTPDGYLINTFSASAENGELVSNLEFSRNDEDDWVVSGDLQGKALNEVISGDNYPLSELGQMQATQDLFAGEESRVEFPVWVPDADPTQILTGSVTRDDADTALKGIIELGPMSLNAQFDEVGSVVDADMQLGPSTISFERIWTQGAPHTNE